MKDSPPSSLKEAAEEFRRKNKEETRASTITRAFELFSQETERLENAYNSLKEEFMSIHHELEAANEKLSRKVKELGTLTFYLDNLLSNISQGILFIDLNGDITTFNMAAEEILNVDAKEVLHRSFWHHFPDDMFGFSIRKALADKRAPVSSSATIETVNQINRHLDINATFVSKQSKEEGDETIDATIRKLEGIIIVVRDVTHLRSLELIALRNDRMKELGEMAAMVAHEIRNPIGGIKGFASLLRRDVEENSKQYEMINHIIQGTETLNNLVTNVLNYSRPNSLNFQKCDVIELVKNLKEHFDADISRKQENITLSIQTKLEKLLLHIDPKIFNSALMNLLYNARDAMSEHGGTITLSIECFKKLAMVKVADEGCGIPEDNLEKVFTPLFTTKSEGNGFGLAEVHKNIQAHHGVVEVESTIGKGTVFTITLPLLDDEPEPQNMKVGQ